MVLEKIQAAPPTGASNTSVTANLVIPAGVATGTTRMRVSMRRGAFAGPCELLSYGEVEDYSVNITGGSTGSCSINANISAITCDDNGTPTIGSDDTYTFKALVTGTNTGSSWTATTGINAVSGTYGQERVLGPYSILQNTTVIFTDQTNNTCTTTADVQKPNPCSNGGGNGTYCTSSSDFPWHDWIAQIKVADLDHVTGKSQYSHYPDKVATVTTGATHTIQLTGGYSWLVEDEFWRIWIDYNHDGSFTSDEIAFSQFNPKLPYAAALWSINGSITIPATAPTGITRMRIVMQRGNTPPSACGTYVNGETEDYSVNIVNGTGSTCAISATISSLACQNKGTSTPTDDTYSFDLLVTGAGSASSLGWKATFGSTTIKGLYGQSKSIQNQLISAGNLTILVRDSIDLNCTRTVSVTAPAACSNTTGPCTLVSDFPWHDWIDGVKFADLNQVSTKSQYSDFTNQVAHVRQDSAYVLTLGAGYSWFAFHDFWRIWVDGNDNGSWEANELVFEKQFPVQANGLTHADYIDTIRFTTVPVGTHKMRVAMRRDAFADACGTIDYGEVEDYTVQVSQNLQRTAQFSYEKPAIDFENAWAVYPNPTSDRFWIQLQNMLDVPATVTMIDPFGRVVLKKEIRAGQHTTEVETTDLANGLYLLELAESGKRPSVKKVFIVRE